MVYQKNQSNTIRYLSHWLYFPAENQQFRIGDLFLLGEVIVRNYFSVMLGGIE